MTLANRLVVLDGGRIEQVGTPIELYGRPASVFVASFIGSPAMKLLPAGGGGAQATVFDGALSGVANLPNGPFTLGLRPEAFSFGTSDGAAGYAADVVVTAVELVGAESYVHGTPVGGSGDIVFRTAGRSILSLGETVPLFAPATTLHRFDTDGRRIG